MHIEEFAVERWMDRYETTCRYNLAESCVDSLTVRELLELAGKEGTILDELLPIKLAYGAIAGSDRLRGLVASLSWNGDSPRSPRSSTAARWPSRHEPPLFPADGSTGKKK